MTFVAVIDTNIVISGVLSKNSAPYMILSCMLQAKFPYLLSTELLSEYQRVLKRENVRKYHGLDHDEIEELLISLTENGILREITEIDEKAPHKNDNHLWQLLYTQPSSILVTGDLLLIKKPPPFAQVMLPDEFTQIMKS